MDWGPSEANSSALERALGGSCDDLRNTFCNGSVSERPHLHLFSSLTPCRQASEFLRFLDSGSLIQAQTPAPATVENHAASVVSGKARACRAGGLSALDPMLPSPGHSDLWNSALNFLELFFLLWARVPLAGSQVKFAGSSRPCMNWCCSFFGGQGLDFSRQGFLFCSPDCPGTHFVDQPGRELRS